MPRVAIVPVPDRKPSRRATGAWLLPLLAACGPIGAATPTSSDTEPVEFVGDATLAQLHDDFLVTAGSDRVKVTADATLSPKMRFRLERQALWLRDYPNVAVRLHSEAPRLTVAERRLAMRRAEAVQDYLIEVGVDRRQISGIDVGLGKVAGVVTRLDAIRTDLGPLAWCRSIQMRK